MANITITSCDAFSVALGDAVRRDDTLKASGAHTYKEGTILARRKVVTAVTPAAGANTGNGTCTAASVVTGPVVPLVGTYVLKCITAVANGGIFNLADPNGSVVASYLPMTVGAGAATVFIAGGLTFTLTDAATDFVAGDLFSLPVVADGTLVAYASAGVGGAQQPLCVLPYEVVTTGAGNNPVRVIREGSVNKTRLVVDADGDATNVNATVIDALNANDIIAVDVLQNAVADNS